MERASRRKGGLPNALFLVAAAESLPHELDGHAAEVTIHFPWGSLLRGVLNAAPWLAAALERVTRPGALVDAFLSVTERDGILGFSTLDDATVARIASSWSAQGFTVESAAPATSGEIAATHSTWAKRLGTGRTRPAWRLRLQR